MSWVLVQNGSQRRLRLRPGTIQVGRAQTTQIKATHQSVSRIHAEIVVDGHVGPLMQVAPTGIYVVDQSSTGHTFVNGKPSLGKGQRTALSNGDLLAFGVDPATFTAVWSPMVLSYSSRAPAEEAQAMAVLARTAGVFLTSDWTPECTHLLIEQLAITPKLLCCVADGGIPVAPSYLDALSKSGLAEPAPDPSRHRPRPPMGVDAEYARELAAFMDAPKARRAMLAGVWVVFGIRQAYDVLALALSHAGSQVHVLCTPDMQAARVAEELGRNLAKHGKPRAVWIVPGLDDATAAVLGPALEALDAPCLAVSHKAAVAGILAGRLDAAHAEATPMTLSAKGPADGSFPATQQQQQQQPQGAAGPGRRRAVPWAPGTFHAAKTLVKEESFPNTDQIGHKPPQPGVQLQVGGATSSTGRPRPWPASDAGAAAEREAKDAKEGEKPAERAPTLASLAEPVGPPAMGRRKPFQGLAAAPGAGSSPPAKRARQAPWGPAAAGLPGANGREALGAGGAVKEQDSPEKPRTAAAPRPGGGAGAETPKPEEARNGRDVDGAPLTLSSEASGMKEEKEEEKKQPDGAAFAAVRRPGAPGLGAGALTVPETPASQVKPEPLPPALVESSAVKAEAAEQKLAAAAAAVEGRGGPGAGGAAAAAAPAPGSPPQRRVQHPTGVWLTSLGQGTSPEGQAVQESCLVDGVEVPRAACRAVPNLARRPRAPGAAAVAERPRGRGSRGCNFKLFRKAQGQRGLPREHVVPVAPWLPAAGPPLAEIFGSQPLGGDSDSQLLPQLPPGL